MAVGTHNFPQPWAASSTLLTASGFQQVTAKPHVLMLGRRVTEGPEGPAGSAGRVCSHALHWQAYGTTLHPLPSSLPRAFPSEWRDSGTDTGYEVNHVTALALGPQGSSSSVCPSDGPGPGLDRDTVQGKCQRLPSQACDCIGPVSLGELAI